ncbi:PIG-L family deacetylase [Micromonospora sp. NPDC049282]|uniref:PIG-L family deacetylase n=1 Tax=Micromonospora sp. NPDC049282 TaxID=3364269 RepID=UPI0037135C0E
MTSRVLGPADIVALTDLLGPDGVLVVSPHLDDAMLSTTGLLTRLGRPTVVATVFAGSPDQARSVSDWDRYCGFDDASGAARVRAEEDRIACAVLGATALHLTGVDGAYGGGGGGLDELRAVLAGLPDGTTVLLPAGIGGHQDHVRVRNDGLRWLTGRTRVGVQLYADLPYAAALWHWGAEGSERVLGDRHALRTIAMLDDPPAEAVLRWVRLSGAEWAVKRRAVWAYASQLAPLSVTARGLMSCPGPLQTEAVWRIR